jgi:hypothetical protein
MTVFVSSTELERAKRNPPKSVRLTPFSAARTPSWFGEDTCMPKIIRAEKAYVAASA